VALVRRFKPVLPLFRIKMSSQNISSVGLLHARTTTMYPVITILVSLLTIVAAYILSISELEADRKIQGFCGIIAVYLCVYVVLYFHQKRLKQGTNARRPMLEADVERSLEELDEVSSYFTGSLRSDDAFRLVASRVRDLLPYQTIVLFLLTESRSQLVSVHAEGVRAEVHKGQLLNFDDGLAGQAYKTHQVEVDGYLMLDSNQEYGSSVAIPLMNAGNVFGVIQLFFGDDYDPAVNETSVFEAVGTRVAPLMLGSISYERSQANALTDVTTDLPNERAFYLVLENQVAESQRRRDDRPLTVLAIDIENFDEVNRTFGHVAGDTVLNFVARVIKDNVRQMDFVARALNDEFLVILPTADKGISQEVMQRIQAGFSGRKLAINEAQAVEIELNIGWAVFGIDGETPGQLLSLAQLRKEQMKFTGPSNLLFFPNEPRESAH